MTVEQDHVDAVLALLQASPGSPALVAYSGAVDPRGTPPYVAVYFVFDYPVGAVGNNLTTASSQINMRMICHCVGGNGEAAIAVAARVKRQLLDALPAMPGRQVGFIRHDYSQDPVLDETTGSPVMDAISAYRLTTNP